MKQPPSANSRVTLPQAEIITLVSRETEISRSIRKRTAPDPCTRQAKCRGRLSIRFSRHGTPRILPRPHLLHRDSPDDPIRSLVPAASRPASRRGNRPIASPPSPAHASRRRLSNATLPRSVGVALWRPQLLPASTTTQTRSSRHLPSAVAIFRFTSSPDNVTLTLLAQSVAARCSHTDVIAVTA